MPLFSAPALLVHHCTLIPKDNQIIPLTERTQSSENISILSHKIKELVSGKKSWDSNSGLILQPSFLPKHHVNNRNTSNKYQMIAIIIIKVITSGVKHALIYMISFDLYIKPVRQITRVINTIYRWGTPGDQHVTPG